MMMIPLIVLCVGIILAVALAYLAYWAASTQNEAIDVCFDRRRKHDKLLSGELYIRDIPDSQLIALSNPLWTHVGMGGVGPRYTPSFTVFSLIGDELARRRAISHLDRIWKK